MMPFAEEWDDILVYLVSPLSRELARSRLERISGSWPSDVGQLKHSIALASQGHLQELMLMHLLARVLLAGRSAPKWLKRWLMENKAVEMILSEIPPRKAFSLKWEAVPVPIVKMDGQGGMFMMIIAALKNVTGVAMPHWSQETMEHDCMEAIGRACSASTNLSPSHSKDTGFFCWPLLDPGGPPVKGQSLGLPLSIALSMIGQNSCWPKSLMATGSIDDQGNILPVGGLMAKSRVAAEFGAQLFLYPDDEKIDFSEWPVPALPVSDLKQAMTFAHLIAIGLPAVSNFRLYYSCLQNPLLLLDNFNNIPDSVLEWARDRGILGRIKEVCSSTNGFAGVVSKLGDCSLPSRHRELLASVLCDDDLDCFAVRSSQDALMVSNWYSHLAELNAGKVDVEKSQLLKKKAKKIFREFGNKIYVFYRTDDHQACYQKFDKDLGICLKRQADGPLKTFVSNVWRKQAIYIHLPITRGDEASVRVLLSENDKVVALSLNARNLDIDPEQGKAQFIEDCMHAVYLGLIRAVFFINKKRLMADPKLHILLSLYLGELITWVVSQEIHLDKASHENLAAVCNYYYAACFMGLEPEEAAVWQPEGDVCLKAANKPIIGKELLGARDTVDSLRWISNLLSQTGLTPNADWLWRRLITTLNRETCYALGGALDHFMGLCVLSFYPTMLLENSLTASESISKAVEAMLVPYMTSIEYATAQSQGKSAQP